VPGAAPLMVGFSQLMSTANVYKSPLFGYAVGFLFVTSKSLIKGLKVRSHAFRISLF
jgi:hypothetical protein